MVWSADPWSIEVVRVVGDYIMQVCSICRRARLVVVGVAEVEADIG